MLIEVEESGKFNRQLLFPVSGGVNVEREKSIKNVCQIPPLSLSHTLF